MIVTRIYAYLCLITYIIEIIHLWTNALELKFQFQQRQATSILHQRSNRSSLKRSPLLF